MKFLMVAGSSELPPEHWFRRKFRAGNIVLYIGPISVTTGRGMHSSPVSAVGVWVGRVLYDGTMVVSTTSRTFVIADGYSIFINLKMKFYEIVRIV